MPARLQRGFARDHLLEAVAQRPSSYVQDILIAVADGRKGLPEAIIAAFPDALVQTCIIHLVRHSLNFCSWKDRKGVAADLRRIHGAATATWLLPSPMSSRKNGPRNTHLSPRPGAGVADEADP